MNSQKIARRLKSFLKDPFNVLLIGAGAVQIHSIFLIVLVIFGIGVGNSLLISVPFGLLALFLGAYWSGGHEESLDFAYDDGTAPADGGGVSPAEDPNEELWRMVGKNEW